MISNVKNPGSAQQVTGFIFRFYGTLSSTTPLDTSSSNAFYMQFTPDTLSAGVILPGSYKVGEVTNWRVSVIPKNPIPAGGILQISFPKWTDASRYSIGAQSMLSSGTNTCIVLSGLSSSSLSCTFTVNSIASGVDTLTITGAFSAVQTSGSAFEIEIDSVTNMPTCRSYTTFAIQTMDSNQFAIDSAPGITVAMLQPAIIPTSQVSVIINPPSSVDAITSYLFTVFVDIPVPVGASIEVIIPQQIIADSLETVIPNQRISSSVTLSFASSDKRDVFLTGGFPTLTDSVGGQSLVAFTLQNLQNPSASTATNSFQIIIYDGSDKIQENTEDLTVTAKTGSVTMSTFTFSNSRVLDYNDFTFSMTLESALQSSCTIQIIFPTEFTIPNVATTSCLLAGTVGLSQSYSCSFVANKLTIYTPFGSTTSTGNNQIKFTIANNYIQNPVSTKPTATKIIVQTVSQNQSPIDSWLGSQFTAVVNSLLSASVSASSLTAGAQNVVYTFTFQTPHQVAANAQIFITPPSGDVKIFDSNVLQDTLQAQSTVVQTYMSASIQAGDIKVKGGFYGTQCACTGIIKFRMGGFLNPRSTAPSDSFSIALFTSDNYPIYRLSSDIQVTMTTPNTRTNMTIKSQFGVNGALDNYLVSVANFNEKKTGDYMLLYAPEEVTFLKTTQCQPKTNTQGIQSCGLVGTNTLKIIFTFSGVLSPGTGFAFMLLGVKNPASMAPSSRFRFETFDSETYIISNITSGPIVTNTKPGTLQSATIRPSVYQDGQWTNLTFTIYPQSYLKFMSMSIIVPPDMLIPTVNPNLCQAVSTYTVSPSLQCKYQTETRTLNITDAFTVLSTSQYNSASVTLKPIQIMIGQFVNPVGKTQSGNFTITTNQGDYPIEAINVSIPYVCSPSCLTCDIKDYTQCTSCNQNTVYKYLYLGQCVSVCPQGSTQTQKACLVCPSNCQTCSSTNNSCLICNQDFFLYQGSCVSSCPSGTILSGPTSCEDPEPPPVFQFTTYFQKTKSYQCGLFPFSIASVVTVVLAWIASLYSSKLILREIQKCRENNTKEHRFMSPIRVIELSITIISVIEIIAWAFFLYCMKQLEQMLPFYVICGAIGMNFFLNFLMTCGIMKSKEITDDYISEYAERFSWTYRLIKVFTFCISHKGFYIGFARYQRNRNCHSHFDFTYFDNGDDDGVSGFCFKFFFITSIFLLHGAVIAACVLNYMVNDLSAQLFCLDLDIIGITTFQALLILLTLLQCGGERSPEKIYPRFRDDDEPESIRGLDDQDTTGKYRKGNRSVSQIRPRDEEDEEEELAERRGSRNTRQNTGNTRQNSITNSRQNSKLPFKNRPIMEDDEEDEGDDPSNRKSAARKNGKPIISRSRDRDDSTEDQNNNFFTNQSRMSMKKRDIRKKRRRSDLSSQHDASSQNEQDSQTIDPNRKKRRRKRGNRGSKDDSGEESDSAVDVTPNRKRKRRARKGQNGQQDDSVSEESELTAREGHKKPKKKKNRARDGEEESSEESQPGKQKKRRKKKTVNGVVVDATSEDSDEASPKIKAKKIKPPVFHQVSHSASSAAEDEAALEQQHEGPQFEKHVDPTTGAEKPRLMPEDHPHDPSEEPQYHGLVQHINTLAEKEKIQLKGEEGAAAGQTCQEKQDENKGRKHLTNDIQPKFGLKISDSRSSLPIEANIADRHLLKGKRDDGATLQATDPITQGGHDPKLTKSSALEGKPSEHDIQPFRDGNDKIQRESLRIKGHQQDEDDDDKITNLMKKLPSHKSHYNPSDPSLLQSSSKQSPEHVSQKTRNHLNQDSKEEIFNPDEPNDQMRGQHPRMKDPSGKEKKRPEKKSGNTDNQAKNAPSQKQSNRYSQEDENSHPADYELVNKQKTDSMNPQPAGDSRGISPLEEYKQPKQKKPIVSSREHSHQETDELDDENNDFVNKDDIKPRPVVIFSDKSESSVEEMMEDTPSNYNVLNGRLDEDSKGLRSIMYKALSKKLLYQRMQEKAKDQKEDQESRRIMSKGSDRKSSSQGRPTVNDQELQQRREQAKLFIQKAEARGVGLFGTLPSQAERPQSQIQNNSKP